MWLFPSSVVLPELLSAEYYSSLPQAHVTVKVAFKSSCNRVDQAVYEPNCMDVPNGIGPPGEAWADGSSFHDIDHTRLPSERESELAELSEL